MTATDQTNNRKITYKELVAAYQKRQRDTVVDAVAMGLTYLDEIAVETGLLEEAGILPEVADSVTGALPFVVIAVTEGSKVIFGKKSVKRGMKDGATRMVKTGVAVGVGAAVTTLAGFWAAIPATMGVRALFDRYRSKALAGRRVQGRITRLQEIQAGLNAQPSAYAPHDNMVIPHLPEQQALIEQ